MIGNGNVALDVARMLALTEEELAPTDTTDAAIAAIVGSGIEEIVVLGRRGPVQAAWTPPELAELGELAGADVIVDPAELELDPTSEAELDAADHIVKRNLEVLHGVRRTRVPAGKPRRVVLRFRALADGDSRRGARRGGRARAERARAGRPRQRARCRNGRARDACVRRRLPERRLSRAAARRLPFDEATGTMPNDGGRVLGEDGAPLPGVYCAGWIKRGPTGVIGTNKKDASETVELLLADAEAGAIGGCEASAADVDALLAERGVAVVTQAGWEAIDEAERALGEPQGRPRVKLTSWDELLAAARARRRQPCPPVDASGTELAHLSARHWDVARLALVAATSSSSSGAVRRRRR